jgi:hypothetical protein
MAKRTPSPASTANFLLRAAVYGAVAGAAVGVFQVPDHFEINNMIIYISMYSLFGIIAAVVASAIWVLSARGKGDGGGP